ncbi:galactose mutarotase [Jiella sp. MQZ9-1]|uniref:Aldose 1-epimerase n=1 Tax=Jiella flava TaxID=2816857 RepID=A0A939JRC6_9HYPH|nr:aldose epimerase family protein [Jiella flava]MBO0661773.1 galactose mutarotase [Jiella flava]MCD2470414.1 galactose mutarotase [Jiella flava]
MGDDTIFAIDHDGMTVEIAAMGASVKTLSPRGASHSMILGLAANDYGLSNTGYIGASVGRFANRIARGRFTVDGETYSLPVNDGLNHLHGGPRGFSHRVWSLSSRTDRDVVLTLHSPAGEEGYPGALDATARFKILSGEEFEIVYEAITDAPTLANLTAHLYFNLDGAGDALGHRLSVAADDYLPVDDSLIPTGTLAPVAQTPFDFRGLRPLADRPAVLDHNFCLASTRHGAPHPAAWLEASASGWALELATTEPGLQVYDGAKLDGSQSDAAGRPIQAHAGLALEPQVWPDSPNHPSFPSAILRPGEIYRTISRYRFILHS